MSDEKNILIYASHYEHINRGCMEDILRRFNGFNIRLTLLVCNNSHRLCYLNQCLSNSGESFYDNHLEACKICFSNQLVFKKYADQLGIVCGTIFLNEAESNNQLSPELVDLVHFCLPQISDPFLFDRLNSNPSIVSEIGRASCRERV